jgi:hypothetical protein
MSDSASDFGSEGRSDGESQVVIPAAFIALFVPPGRIKPTESRAFIAERHEFCEDLAGTLTETAQQHLWNLGVTEGDVLERIHRGLSETVGGQAAVTAAEARWVIGRLAELLDWAYVLPEPPPSA